MRDWLKTIALLVVSGLTSLVLWDLHALIRDERTTAATTLRDFHVTILEGGLTLKNLREASETWKKASQEQAANSTKATARVSAAAEQLSSFVSNTDRSVNASLLPAMTQAITQQNAALLTSQEALQANLKAMMLATQQLQKTLADADVQISNPAIQKSLDALSVASQNAAEATRHLSNVTADAERTADYYAKKLTTPQSFLKTVAQAILQLGSQARILLNK